MSKAWRRRTSSACRTATKACLAAAMCSRMIELAHEAGRRVLVDPALGRDYSQYRGATLLTPNRQEAAAAVGFAVETASDAARAARQLLDDLSLDAVVVTLDREGACLSHRGRERAGAGPGSQRL